MAVFPLGIADKVSGCSRRHPGHQSLARTLRASHRVHQKSVAEGAGHRCWNQVLTVIGRWMVEKVICWLMGVATQPESGMLVLRGRVDRGLAYALLLPAPA